MYFDFRYYSNKANTLGKDIIKMLSDAEINNLALTSPDELRLFATLLIECDKCELTKIDYEE